MTALDPAAPFTFDKNVYLTMFVNRHQEWFTAAMDEAEREWAALLGEIDRLRAENEAQRDRHADLNLNWAQSLADAYVERDERQARIDAALALCDEAVREGRFIAAVYIHDLRAALEGTSG